MISKLLTFVFLLPCSFLISQESRFLELFEKEKYREIISLPAHSIEEHYIQGISYEKLGRNASAIQAFLSIYQIDSTHEDAIYRLSRLYNKKREYSESLTYMEKLTIPYQEKSYYWRELGDIYLASKNDYNTLLKYKKLPDQRRKVYYYLDSCALNSYYHGLDLDTLDLSAHFKIASIYNRQQEFTKSLPHYTFCYQQDTTMKDALFQQAYIEYKLENHHSAEELFKDYFGKYDAEIRAIKVRAYNAYKLDSFNLCKILMTGLSQYDNEPSAHYYLALIASNEGDHKGAQYHYTKMMKELYTNVQEEYLLGYTFYLEDTKPDEASFLYKYATKYVDNKETLYHFARFAETYYRDRSIALNYYQKYLSLEDKEYVDIVKERIKYLKTLIHMKKSR